MLPSPLTGGTKGMLMAETDPTISMRVVETVPNPPADGMTSGDGSFLQGTHVTVRATENVGHHFTHWSFINGLEASKDQAYTFVVTADTLLTANFAEGEPANAGLLVVLHECEATGEYKREVWISPMHIVYAVRHADVSHLKMTDGATIFVSELPRDISLLVASASNPKGGEHANRSDLLGDNAAVDTGGDRPKMGRRSDAVDRTRR
jgi:hypothetical protein